MPPKLVGDHRGLRPDGRHDGDADTFALHRFDQPPEVAVAGEEHDMIELFGHLQHVDGQLDVHVALDLASTGGVGEFLGRLGDHGVAVVVEPIDQRPNRGVFLIFHQGCVVISAHEATVLVEDLVEPPIIDVKTQGPGRGVEIGAVDEERDAFFSVKPHSEPFLVVCR